MATPEPVLGDRSLFPTLAGEAYLNWAAIAPPSTPVQQAVTALMGEYASKGVAAVGPAFAAREQLRAALGELLGVAAGTLGFVPNTTRGVADVAAGIPWRAGERVVVFGGEFPTNVTPWAVAARTEGLELVPVPLAGFFDDRDAGFERGLAALDAVLAHGGVRLVAVSAVQFQTGLRMPVEAIASRCRFHGAEVFVDAIQAAGGVPIDLDALGVDYAAGGAHKWLMGLEGGGWLYVRDDRAKTLRPRMAGWLSHTDPLAFLFAGPGHMDYGAPIVARAGMVEGGVQPALPLAALGASVPLLNALGVATIHRHVQRYLDALEEGLVARGFRSLRAGADEGRSGILAVDAPDDLAARIAEHTPGGDAARHPVPVLAEGLGARGVGVSTPDGRLRFAPHWPNAISEVPVVLRAVDEVLDAVRAGEEGTS